MDINFKIMSLYHQAIALGGISTILCSTIHTCKNPRQPPVKTCSSLAVHAGTGLPLPSTGYNIP